jgi:hypothetical protein
MRGWVCSIHGKLKKCIENFIIQHTGENIWENPGADNGIILKLILKK